MDKKKGLPKIEELAWQNFYETGEIGAYLLYKELTKNEVKHKPNKEKTDNKNDWLLTDWFR